LIKEVDNENFVKLLKQLGYSGLHIQYGRGNKPNLESKNIDGFDIKVYDIILKGYEDKVRNSSLIVGHGGAGTILTALHSGKKLIVVPNERLMNNHQMELANHLSKQNLLLFTRLTDKSNSLSNLVQKSATESFSRLPNETTRFRQLVNQEMNFQT